MPKTVIEVASDYEIDEIHIRLFRNSLNYFVPEGTPLHWAAGKGRSEAIKFLVEKGSKIDLVSSQGLTAVLMAAVSSSLSALHCLHFYISLSNPVVKTLPVRCLRSPRYPNLLWLLTDICTSMFCGKYDFY
jgi:ankyrin repeat protein